MNFRGRRILITGAAGFIGANLTETLVGHGANVSVLVKADTDLWRLVAVHQQIALYRGDLRDGTELQRLVKAIQPELIFHMARALPASTAGERSAALDTNVMGLLNLLEATDPLDYQHFVCGSSSLEYGSRAQALKESDFPDPTSFFGATKAAATVLCRQYARANQRPISILRFFSVYGPWEPAKRLIPTAIAAALLNRELPLTQPGYHRDFIFVEDVVRACLLASQAQLPSGEILNIGSGVQTSNEEVVTLIGQLCGQELRLRIGDYAPHETDTTHWVADNLKAKSLLGWTPQFTLEDGLKKTIAWLQQHRSPYLID